MTADKGSRHGPGVDVVVARTRICDIDPVAGKLRYCGYPIEDLAGRASFEEVCHLLWSQRAPNAEEAAGLKAELASYRDTPRPAIELLSSFPRDVHPLTAVRSAVSALGAFDPDGDDASPEAGARKARRLTAQVATLVAAWERIRRGREPVKPDPKLSHAGNFLYMTFGRRPRPESERAMDAVLTLYADHGLSASAFVARTTAATRADVHSAVTAALAALKGPLHGGAMQAAFELLQRIAEPDQTEAFVDQAALSGEAVPGFGGPTYRAADPRARLFAAAAETLAKKPADRRWLEVARRLEAAVAKALDRRPVAHLWSAPLLYLLKFPPDLFSSVFAVARVAGWTAHVLEQQAADHMLRPKSEYVGAPERRWPGLSADRPQAGS